MRKLIYFPLCMVVILLASGCRQMSCPCGDDIVCVAAQDCELSTFVKATFFACLDDELKNSGPYTVFVPSNSAFAKLPDGVVNSLMKKENYKYLASTMNYHVVPGKYKMKDLCANRKLKTLYCDKEVWITPCCGGAKVNDSKIIKANIPACNGVIHVIDAVLEP